MYVILSHWLLTSTINVVVIQQLFPSLAFVRMNICPQSNAIKWARGVKRPPWRLITLVREIRDMTAGLEVSFVHISRSANGVADFFAKHGVEGETRGTFHLPGGWIVAFQFWGACCLYVFVFEFLFVYFFVGV